MAFMAETGTATLSGGSTHTYAPTTAYTLAMWCRGLNGYVGGGTLFRCVGNNGTNVQGIRLGTLFGNPPDLRMGHGDDSAVTESALAGWRRFVHRGHGPDGQWWHLGLTWNSTDQVVRWHFNGAYVASTAQTVSPTTGGTRQTDVGGFNAAQSGFADIRFWGSRCLDSDEIGLLYRGGTVPAPDGWWGVGSGSRNAVDRSGNGNHLTFNEAGQRQPTAEPVWITSRTLAARLV